MLGLLLNKKRLTGIDMQKSRFEGIEEFIQVVETGSFTAAAERLAVSKSFISKQIKALEQRFNAALLQRTTRQLRLTAVGETFYEQCQAMNTQLEHAETLISSLQHEPLGTLRIALNSTFGVQYMATAIAEFSQLHPLLELDITSSYDDIDLLQQGYDLTIRYGDRLDDSSLVAKPLGGYHLCLCATPDYFEQYGQPESTQDLNQHNCLSNPGAYWYFSDAEVSKRIKVKGNWQSKDGMAILAATRVGIGLAQLPEFVIHEDLKQGRLIKVSQKWASYHRMAWAVYPSNRHLSAKVRLFLDFLREYTETQLTLQEVFS